MPLDATPAQAPPGPQKNPEKLALVIPTFHEKENVLVLLDCVKRVLDSAEIRHEILVIDDDSRDGIVEAVAAVYRSDPRVRVVVRQEERGLSGAILHGWERTDAEILGVMDADMQHPPDLLPELHRAILGGHDLVIGSRYAAGGGLQGWNPVRKLLSAAAVRMTRPLQHKGIQARDPMSGFFLVRRRCIDGIPFQKTGFKLLLEILVRGRVRSVQEIPFMFGHRHAGRSKAGIRVALDYFALLSRLYRERCGLSRQTDSVEQLNG